jgi:hypothetical protein
MQLVLSVFFKYMFTVTVYSTYNPYFSTCVFQLTRTEESRRARVNHEDD